MRASDGLYRTSHIYGIIYEKCGPNEMRTKGPCRFEDWLPSTPLAYFSLYRR